MFARQAPAILASALALSACVAPVTTPLQMPPISAARSIVTLDGTAFAVTRSGMATAPGGEVLRVYRDDLPALDYSGGKLAKTAVQAFCAQYNRALAPEAQGYFEPTGAWVFSGGCL